ncbi:MAG: hypothetical protein ACWA5P_13285 [bacterium]
MSQKTELLNEAIQEFLESIGETDLKPSSISFQKKTNEELHAPQRPCWVWDPVRQKLVYIC